MDREFNTLWVQVGEEVEDRILEQLPQSEMKNFRALLREEKYKLLVQLIREKGFGEGEDEEAVCEDFVRVYLVFREITEAQEHLEKNIADQMVEFQAHIDENYPIRRYAKLWREEQTEMYLTDLRDRLSK